MITVEEYSGFTVAVASNGSTHLLSPSGKTISEVTMGDWRSYHKDIRMWLAKVLWFEQRKMDCIVNANEQSCSNVVQLDKDRTERMSLIKLIEKVLEENYDSDE